MKPEVERARIAELLAAELERCLSSSENFELEALLRVHGDVGREDFALAAASVERAVLREEEFVPLSEAELERLEASAREFFGDASAAPAPGVDWSAKVAKLEERRGSTGSAARAEPAALEERSGRAALLYSGWAIAAVALLALFVQRRMGSDGPVAPSSPGDGSPFARTTETSTPPSAQPSTSARPTSEPAPVKPSPLEERSALLEKPGTVRLAWSHTADPLSEAISGDVVWNAHEQTGFLHFSGLERNDPKATQYQLWIFDGKRNEAHPVDGGVFDSTGESVVVRIDPRVPVHEATLFAITIEPPGGVVVSDRKRIVVVAKPG